MSENLTIAKDPGATMAEEKKDKTGDGKMILIIIAVMVLAIALGSGTYFALKGFNEKKYTPRNDEETANDQEGQDESNGEGETKLSNALLPLDTFIVNLQVKGSFLKTTLQLEFDQPELPQGIEIDTAKIRDAVIRVLSTKTAQEILTPEGKDQLREEIKIAVNEALKVEDIIAVYITEFIIQ